MSLISYCFLGASIQFMNISQVLDLHLGCVRNTALVLRHERVVVRPRLENGQESLAPCPDLLFAI